MKWFSRKKRQRDSSTPPESAEMLDAIARLVEDYSREENAKKEANMTEHNEQVALFQATAFHPELKWLFAIPNGFYSTSGQKAKMKAEGLRPGVWDIFLPLPRGDRHGLFIEMKFGSNKLTPKQIEFGDGMKEQGYECRVAYGWEQAYRFIVQYAGLTPAFEGLD